MILGKLTINQFILPYEAADVNINILTVDKSGIFYSADTFTLSTITWASPEHNAIVIVHCSSTNTISLNGSDNIIPISASISNRGSAFFQWNENINKWIQLGINGGIIGTQGLQGVDGSPGDNGPSGATGSQGLQGASGVPLTGSQGTQGGAGPTGPQGPDGFQGSLGPQGAQGAQGDAGNSGPQGAQGA